MFPDQHLSPVGACHSWLKYVILERDVAMYIMIHNCDHFSMNEIEVVCLLTSEGVLNMHRSVIVHKSFILAKAIKLTVLISK